jgi:hypothetical protein
MGYFTIGIKAMLSHFCSNMAQQGSWVRHNMILYPSYDVLVVMGLIMGAGYATIWYQRFGLNTRHVWNED